MDHSTLNDNARYAMRPFDKILWPHVPHAQRRNLLFVFFVFIRVVFESVNVYPRDNVPLCLRSSFRNCPRPTTQRPRSLQAVSLAVVNLSNISLQVSNERTQHVSIDGGRPTETAVVNRDIKMT